MQEEFKGICNNEIKKLTEVYLKDMPTIDVTNPLKELSSNLASAIPPTNILGKATAEMLKKSFPVSDIFNLYGSALKELAETQRKFGELNNIVSESMSAIEQIAIKTREMVNASLKLLEFEMPKIPRLSPDGLLRLKFTTIVAQCNMPVYFETDTELQDLILDICQNSEEKYPKQEVENCVMDYYTADRLEDLLQYWFSKDWIPKERKEALRQAIVSYNAGLYWGTSSILLTQIGGIITQLYDAIDRNMLMPKAETRELLNVYNVNNPASEKAKGLIMINMQQKGIYGWSGFADYFINYVYANTDDMEHFQFDPGRHKACHGQQLNLGDKLIALKCILIIDMVVQMSEELLSDDAA